MRGRSINAKNATGQFAKDLLISSSRGNTIQALNLTEDTSGVTEYARHLRKGQIAACLLAK